MNDHGKISQKNLNADLSKCKIVTSNHKQVVNHYSMIDYFKIIPYLFCNKRPDNIYVGTIFHSFNLHHFFFLFEDETTIKKQNCNSRCLCLMGGSEGLSTSTCACFHKEEVEKEIFLKAPK